MVEKHRRSIVKGITWRVLATLTTIMLVVIFTKKFYIAVNVGLLEFFSKLGLYYSHERVWNKIKWGMLSEK